MSQQSSVSTNSTKIIFREKIGKRNVNPASSNDSYFYFFLSDDKFDTLRFLCYNSCFNGICYLSKHRINKRHFCQDTVRVGRKTDLSLCSSVFLSRSPDSESFRSLITDNYAIDIFADISDSYSD